MIRSAEYALKQLSGWIKDMQVGPDSASRSSASS